MGFKVMNEQQWSLEKEMELQEHRDGWKVGNESKGYSVVKPELGARELMGDFTIGEWDEYCSMQ